MALNGTYCQLVQLQSGTTTESYQEKADKKQKKIERRRETTAVTEAESEKNKKPYNVSIFRLFRINFPETLHILLGCFGCLINGAINPIFSVIFRSVKSFPFLF
jgi:hypothetical protein